MNKHLSPKFALLACAVAALLTPAAKADFVFHIDLNIPGLVNNANGPFYLDFQLNKGNAAANLNNTVTISNFTFTGGSPVATTDVRSGLATGDLTGTVSLTESSSSQLGNEFYQQFSGATSDIQFDISTTQVSNTSQPDGFSIAILDNTLANITTTAPASSDALTTLALTTGNTLSDVATYSSTSPSGATAIKSVPEPTSAMALVGGLGCLLGLRRRRNA